MKAKLTEKARQKMRENWLAPQGSGVEKQMIESLLNHKALTPHEKAMLLAYRRSGDNTEMHHTGLWLTAKKLKLGVENYELAMSRHKKLESASGEKGNTWLVAYCIANSVASTRKEIGELLGITVDGVKFLKREISKIISEEDGHRLEGMVDDGRITRWFLGM
jgi:hypothetical protein